MHMPANSPKATVISRLWGDIVSITTVNIWECDMYQALYLQVLTHLVLTTIL